MAILLQPLFFHRSILWGVLVLLCACTGGVRSAAVSSDMETLALRPGTSFSEEIRNGQTRERTVPLGAGTFLFAEVRQVGIDAEVTLLGPAGDLLAGAVGAEGPGSLESLALIAREAGDYRLVMRPRDGAAAGRTGGIGHLASFAPSLAPAARSGTGPRWNGAFQIGGQDARG